MNRAERRQMDREDKHELKFINDNEEWYNSLSNNRKEFIRKIILAKVIENDNITSSVIDMCLIAAIDDISDLSAIDEKLIISESNEYMKEYKEYLETNRGDGFKMMEDKMLMDEVISRIIVLKGEGNDKAKTLRQLKKEYNLPNAELSNLWISVKQQDEELKKMSKVIELESINTIDDYVTSQLSIMQIDKELESINTIEGNITTISPVSTLKIKSIEIEGAYGTYLKTSEGITKNNDILYKNVQEVRDHQNIVADAILEDKKELEQTLAKIQEDLTNITAREEESIARFVELEQIFSM